MVLSPLLRRVRSPTAIGGDLERGFLRPAAPAAPVERRPARTRCRASDDGTWLGLGLGLGLVLGLGLGLRLRLRLGRGSGSGSGS
eukprot:scaffold79149_cov21-Phaeocystis_antarctica.AAC.1